MPAGKAYYFKAYDRAGNKRTGSIEAPDPRAADAALRQQGLRPYFVLDRRKVKKALLRRKVKRKQLILGLGIAAIGASLIFSSLLVRYAGRERAPNVAQYRKAGILEGYSGMIYTERKEEREFGVKMVQIWESFYPGVVTGVEVRKLMLTIYVTKRVRKIPDNELDMLVSNTVRALHRQFGAAVCTVLVIRGDETLLEATYDSLSRSVHIRSYG
ncbi:MAG TPA: hypothetical protein HPP77_05275 [Candidatus Hydrogenedentes bacterium]|nr:hypothetical protein [Candidatus Hydrogenedentota bacterium]HIJ74032.1 hypothetical protein [Candidatus Hydrogenedentota bacterium]